MPPKKNQSPYTNQELTLILQMLQQITISDAIAKITAGQLQLKVEASLAGQETQTPPDKSAPDNS